MKILLLDSLHPVFKKIVEENGFELVDGTTWDRKTVTNRVNEFTGLAIRSRFSIDEEIISHSINLKFIARAGSGMENIDVVYARSKNIICINSPEGNRDAVGEHAVGMLLSLLNNLNRSDNQLRNGIWQRTENRGTELSGKTIGIIGFGNTGSAFAIKLSGFDVKILAFDKYITIETEKFPFVLQAGIEKIFEEADILSLHIPLTKETEFMINEGFLNRFKKNIYLVNTSRGKIVQTESLVKLLASGKIKGACLDVFEFEEGSFENIKTQTTAAWEYLTKSDKVILSPHIAGWTHESNEKIASVLANKIISLKLKQ
ncbi:MAG: NAD(P)-dependent oxidoreductase [Bacteroidia bacterium]